MSLTREGYDVDGSETGRKHYLDLGSELFDAGKSAQAVRELLDEAVGRVVLRLAEGR